MLQYHGVSRVQLGTRKEADVDTVYFAWNKDTASGLACGTGHGFLLRNFLTVKQSTQYRLVPGHYFGDTWKSCKRAANWRFQSNRLLL